MADETARLELPFKPGTTAALPAPPGVLPALSLTM